MYVTSNSLILMIAILPMDKTATPKWLYLPLFKQWFSSICVTHPPCNLSLKEKKPRPNFSLFLAGYLLGFTKTPKRL